MSGVQSFTGVQISITPEGMRNVSSSNTNPTLSQPPDAQGRFIFTNVSPGAYRIVARLNRAGGAAGSPGAAATSGPDYVYAVADVDVLGQDVAGVSLALQPGSTLSGRLKFDAASHPAPDDLTTLRVSVSLMIGTSMMMTGNTISAMRSAPIRVSRRDPTAHSRSKTSRLTSSS